MVKSRRYIFINRFKGDPKPSDFKLIEEDLPAVQNGEYLLEAEYLSVDPYMRVYTARRPLGSTMIGSQVGKVIESKNPDFPVGKRVVGYFGWRTHTLVNAALLEEISFMPGKPYIIPDFGDLPASLALGMLGMPGNTAYFGFVEVCKPKQGETVVITGAGGAVGSHVGQIAKILGLTVIGITGSDTKCKWLVDNLGFDYAINYKTEDVAAALKKAAPKGVDCYFDNVGGELSSTIMYQMNSFGRVSVCGSISSYDADVSSLPKCTLVQPAVLFGQLTIQGFIVNQWIERWLEGIQTNLKWIREGKLRYRETVTKGIDNIISAFIGMLHGENVGKAIVQI